MSKKDRHLPIEQDPRRARMWREAWDLLLTDRFTLEQICQELHNRGYTRRSGKPWVWENKQGGTKVYALSHLSRTFHSPFYAGWVTSTKYNIQRGRIRGQWEPLVSDEEFERGIAILVKHDDNKVRQKRYLYRLSGLLHMRTGELAHNDIRKMAGTTPKGRYRSYSYYQTLTKSNGEHRRVSCETVDSQIPEWLKGIQVAPNALPEIKELYQEHIAGLKEPDVSKRLAELNSLIERLHDEEAAIARLYAQRQLTDQK